MSYVIYCPYDVNKPVEIHEVESDVKFFNLARKLINAEWIEVVRCCSTAFRYPGCRIFTMLIDEVGKLREGWPERINWRASPAYSGFPMDPIVGDVVFCVEDWTSSLEKDLFPLNLDEVDFLKFMFENITMKES